MFNRIKVLAGGGDDIRGSIAPTDRYLLLIGVHETEGEDVADADAAGESEPEADDGDAEQEGGEADAERVERPSRAETRFQKLSNEAKQAREEAAAARREAEDTKARLARLENPAQQQKEPTPDEMALWTPDQIIEYKLGKATSRFEQTLGQMQFQQYEMGDKASFKALCASDPVAARYAQEVEERLTDMRAKGQNVDRERLLTYLVGEKVRQKSGGAKRKQAEDGERRIARQTSRPGTSKGDTETPRRGGKTLEERLDGLKF